MIRKLVNTHKPTCLRGKFLLDFPAKKDTIFLAASGRSGSTWIQNIIVHKNSIRTMFEPFHSRKTEILKKWKYFQYIPKNSPNPDFYKTAKAILDGKVRSPWIDSDNTSRFPQKRFIKEIRSNLHIAWLKNRFPRLKLILLLRHPFSVAESSMTLDWDIDLDIRLQQSDLVQNHFPNEIGLLSDIREPFEKTIACWIIDNVVPLRELYADEALVTTYESIKTKPETEITRILDRLNLGQKSDLSKAFSKQSRTTDFGTKRSRFNATKQQKVRAFALMERFGISRIYTEQTNCAPEINLDDIITKF